MGKTTLAYFDMYISAVAGIYGTKYYDKEIHDEEVMGITFGGGLGLGIRFYLTKDISFRLEGKQEVYLKNKGGIQKPLELLVGIGYLF